MLSLDYKNSQVEKIKDRTLVTSTQRATDTTGDDPRRSTGEIKTAAVVTTAAAAAAAAVVAGAGAGAVAAAAAVTAATTVADVVSDVIVGEPHDTRATLDVGTPTKIRTTNRRVCLVFAGKRAYDGARRRRRRRRGRRRRGRRGRRRRRRRRRRGRRRVNDGLDRRR